MQHVLVTGGAGFVGSHVVEELLAAGYEVTVLDCLSPEVHDGPPEYRDERANYVWADVRDRDRLRSLLADVDAVSHQASAVGIGRSMYELDEFVDTNARATAVLFEELLTEGVTVESVVVASSMAVYGEGRFRCPACGVTHSPRDRTTPTGEDDSWDPDCPDCGTTLDPDRTPETAAVDPRSVYATTKFSQERLALAAGRTHDIPVTVLRYFNVYGPRQSLDNPYTGVCATFLNRIANDEPLVVFEDGRQTRDFVHVHDVARANRAALESSAADGTVVNVGTGEPTSIETVAHTLAAACGTDVPVEVTGQYRRGDVRHCTAATDRAEALLGFESSVSFSEGAEELAAWSRDRDPEATTGQAITELRDNGVLRETTDE